MLSGEGLCRARASASRHGVASASPYNGSSSAGQTKSTEPSGVTGGASPAVAVHTASSIRAPHHVAPRTCRTERGGQQGMCHARRLLPRLANAGGGPPAAAGELTPEPEL